jgi:hypothetical protein
MRHHAQWLYMESFKTKILPAILAGSALVAVAFYAEQKRPDIGPDSAIASQVTRKHIQVEDTDADGVPDWQAQVINSDPIYLNSSSSGPYAPDDTVTGRLIYEVITEQDIDMESPFYEVQKDRYAREFVAQLREETKAPTYTAGDLLNIIETEDKDALHAYGNLVGGIIYYHQDPEGELEREVFNRYIRDKNPRHLETLAKIEAQYQAIVDDLLELETPEQYVEKHLAIVNGFAALKHDVYAMQQYFKDPLYATTRVGLHDSDIFSVGSAILNLYDTLYLQEKITFEPDETLRFWADGLRQEI